MAARGGPSGNHQGPGRPDWPPRHAGVGRGRAGGFPARPLPARMTDSDTPETRALVEAAVATALRENREWLRELVQEALVEVAHAEARREADLRATADRRRPYPVPHGLA